MATIVRSFTEPGTVVQSSFTERPSAKYDYIIALTNPEDKICPCVNENYIGFLWNQPLDVVQALYQSLKEVFTLECSNNDRHNIVALLLGIPRDQWPVLIKQLCFIMPIGTRGHDVQWATKILTSIPSPDQRENLVNAGNRFFKYDTLTVERGYILAALAVLSSKELQELEKADEEARSQFITKVVPASLKEGTREILRYDDIRRMWIEV